jgi:hypothetical protein
MLFALMQQRLAGKKQQSGLGSFLDLEPRRRRGWRVENECFREFHQQCTNKKTASLRMAGFCLC